MPVFRKLDGRLLSRKSITGSVTANRIGEGKHLRERRRRLVVESLEQRRLLAYSVIPSFNQDFSQDIDSAVPGSFSFESKISPAGALDTVSTVNAPQPRIPHFFGSQTLLAAASDPAPGILHWDPVQAEFRQQEMAKRLSGNPNYIIQDHGAIVGINPFMTPDEGSDGKDSDGDSGFAPLNPFPPEQTFQLSSLPGATKTIYLDFNGHTTSGTLWNSQFNGGNPIVTPAFNFEGSADTFTNNELFRIQRIWERVAEDFLPFQVNVTTLEPPVNSLRRINSSDTQWGIRVVIGPNTGWFSNAGGVAYLGSFNWSTDTPTFVFSNALGNSEKNIAEAISHEVGHTLGLNHDGSPGNEYYTGHGSGATGWAPIMGVGYNRNLVQWSRGEYPGASNTENDLAIIVSQNGFSYRADDHGNTIATATPLNVVDSVAFAEGIIERNTDIDFFSFTTSGGNVSINIDPFYRSPNLDILAKLFDSSGSLITSSNPVNSLNASFALSLQSGTYFLSVEGTGKPASGTDFGYSDYGSLGYFSIQASIPQEFGSLIASLGNGILTIADSQGLANSLTVEILNGDLIVSDANERFISAPAGATLSNEDRTLTIPAALVSNAVILSLNGGDDAVTVGNWIGAVAPSLSITGGSGNDTVTFINAFLPTAGNSIQVAVDNVVVGPSASLLLSGTGVINIAADNLTVAPSANIVSLGNQVTIAPLTVGRAVNLGTKVSGQLSLTSEELSRISGQPLEIGSSNSGEVTISANITRQTPSDVSIVSGADIVIDNGSFSTGGGLLTLTPGLAPFGVRPKNGDATISASEFSVSGRLVVEINGSEPVSGYDRLNLSGAIDLSSTQLVIADNFQGVSGNETFSIVLADEVIGNFVGLPNESPVTINGETFLIRYTADRVQLAPATVSATIAASFVYHPNSTFSASGVASALDSTKSLAREGAEPVTLTFDNLINSSRGINGVVFDFDGLPASSLSPNDFVFQVSPQGPFNPSVNPPAGWQLASASPSISVINGELDRVVLQWPDNSIANRWLRITVAANANTGLFEPATFYIGHLLGETTGPTNDVYSVTFSDITVIRGAIGQTVNAGSIVDIDKTGIVNFADINAMRGNIGVQLSNITIPALGGSLPSGIPASATLPGSSLRDFPSPMVLGEDPSVFVGLGTSGSSSGRMDSNFQAAGKLTSSNSAHVQLVTVAHTEMNVRKGSPYSAERFFPARESLEAYDAILGDLVSIGDESLSGVSLDELFGQLAD
jgi:hypothetical protein